MNSKEKLKMGSNRNFGLTFSVILFIIAILPLFKNLPVSTLSLGAAFIFLLISFSKPDLFKLINILWTHFGNFLNSLMSPLILGLLFFVVISSLGLLLKLFKKDILDLKRSTQRDSYWTKSDKKQTNLREQF